MRERLEGVLKHCSAMWPAKQKTPKMSSHRSVCSSSTQAMGQSGYTEDGKDTGIRFPSSS